MVRISWNPCDLQQGDTVGLLVDLHGHLWVVLNGQRKVQGPEGVPCGVPLYAVVDLLGGAKAVTLLPSTIPPDCCAGSIRIYNDCASDFEDCGVPGHTVVHQSDPKQWRAEQTALSQRNAHSLAKLRADRCLRNLTRMAGACASLAAVPLGSLGAGAMVRWEMNNILQNFGIPLSVEGATMPSSHYLRNCPVFCNIRQSVNVSIVAGLCGITSSLSTNSLYLLPVVGVVAATIAGPFICGSGTYMILSQFICELEPMAVQLYELQWHQDAAYEERLVMQNGEVSAESEDWNPCAAESLSSDMAHILSN